MNWEAIGAIGEIVSGIVVVASLIYLAAIGKKGFSTIEVTLHPDVEHYLANVKRRTLLNLEQLFQKNVILIGDPKIKGGEVRTRLSLRRHALGQGKV